MLDIKFIRENINKVHDSIAVRNDNIPIDLLLELDAKRRSKLSELEGLRYKRKDIARQKIFDNLNDGRDLRSNIKMLEKNLKDLDDQLQDLLLQIPNIPHSSVPIGSNENDNVTSYSWGEFPNLDFQPLSHWQLGESLDIIDFDTGVKLSGSRFYILKGQGARLQRALISFMLDLHTNEHGYQEVYLPFMVKRESMVGSGNLPKFADNLYHDEEDDLWFIPTAEVPITNLHRDEIIASSNLPIFYVAYTACFRREKMSAGRDSRGLKRGHQFDKVELYKIVEPSTSDIELQKLTEDAETVCKKLKLPYRVIELCTSELSFASTKSYDIEVWAAGCGEWLEVSSCSNCGDFQARRTNIRYRPLLNKKLEFVHTLNGSGLALPRIMIAILENYQQADGSILVPDILQPYMKSKIITTIH